MIVSDFQANIEIPTRGSGKYKLQVVTSPVSGLVDRQSSFVNLFGKVFDL